MGSFTLNIITDTAPDQLVPHAETICNMFLAAINASDANGNVMTPVVYNILCALSNLAPFIQEQGNAKTTYQNLIPYVVKTLQVYAINDSEKVRNEKFATMGQQFNWQATTSNETLSTGWWWNI